MKKLYALLILTISTISIIKAQLISANRLLLFLIILLSSCSYYTRIPPKDEQVAKEINELRIRTCKSNNIICPGNKIFLDNGSLISGVIDSIYESKIILTNGKAIEINQDIKTIKVRRFSTPASVALIVGFWPAYVALYKKTVFDSLNDNKIEIIKTKYQKPDRTYGGRVKVKCQ